MHSVRAACTPPKEVPVKSGEIALVPAEHHAAAERTPAAMPSAEAAAEREPGALPNNGGSAASAAERHHA
ncbi:hypothetical protein WJX75_009453 [Coccomyxa subellipsoidea]|uniref:Uncharacterized protein n=1 Tax=Coccomyxa subellipsoidea TaxID=248742 RepID=A0ABR2Z5A7_9CHLO